MRKISVLLAVLIFIPILSNCSSSDPISPNDNIYFLLVDRFSNGETETTDAFWDINPNAPKAYHGGDLQGVIKKLDYLQDLGITAIWLSPVADNETGGYHGYWIEDFYKVEEHFGTMEDLQSLVKEAHARDIKVILDHVVNHTGYNSPWLKDEEKSQWYNPRTDIINWSDPIQLETGWLAGLPDLDFSNPDVQSFMIENTLWWIDETGVDGFRLDTMRHVPHEFWKDFSIAIKSKYPDFYLIGEVWSNDVKQLESYHQDGIDGLTNYSLYEGLREAFSDGGESYTLIQAVRKEDRLSKPDWNGLFIDNHDNARMLSVGSEGQAHVKQSLAFLYTYPTIPILYYGTELGLEGGSDPDNRRDMPWDRLEEPPAIYQWTKDLIRLRQSIVSEGDPEYQILSYDRYAFASILEAGNKKLISIYNLLNKEKAFEVDLSEVSGLNFPVTLTNPIDGESYTFDTPLQTLTLPPKAVILLQP
jgi:alpha-amylase